MSYLELPLSIVWVDSTQSPSRRTKVGNLAYGDENTVWWVDKMNEIERCVGGGMV